MGKDNYVADGLKRRGHVVIEESRWKDFDKMVDNNCRSWFGLRYLEGVISICEIMHDGSLPLEQRRRKAYDLFQGQDHSGFSASMTMDALRHLCTDGCTLADEIEDSKYGPHGGLSERRKRERWMNEYRERQWKIHEEEMKHRHVRDFQVLRMGTGEAVATIPVYTTNGGMFLIEYPYRSSWVDCLKITRHICSVLGLCYGIFNSVPMFPFDTLDTFFRRQHNGMTQEDHDEFMDALFGDNEDDEKAKRILKEKTWKHLKK